jgi:signal transduction histidine kinase
METRRHPSEILRLSLAFLRSRGRERRSAEFLQFERLLRFAGLFAVTVFVPSLLIAVLGLTDTLGGERALRSEVVLEAEGALMACLKQVEAIFEPFEAKATGRVLQHRSAVDAPIEISPFLLVAVTLDASGRVVEPFDLPDESSPTERSFYISGPVQQARVAEMEGRGEEALQLYQKASLRAHGAAQRGYTEVQRARLLARLGRAREAEDQLADIIAEYGSLLDPNGFLIGDLARLERAGLQLQREPESGTQAFEDLLDQILARRWVVGRGGDAAVARRALSILETRLPLPATVNRRNRLEDLSAALFQAERLLPELEVIGLQGTLLKVSPGQFRYTRGVQALWATVWLRENLEAFALDPVALGEAVADIATESTPAGAQIRLLALAPETPLPETLVAHRTLNPWLTSWTLAAEPRDPEGLAADFRRKRALRLLLIATSTLLITFGAFMLTRIVSREIELASMKTSFAASVSHELRSPITQIRLKGEALQLGLAESEVDRQKHYDAIVRESERLSRLVDNVLDFSAIERGIKQYHLRPGDIATTVASTVEMMRGSVESRGIRLELSLPEDLPAVWHDADAVAQVLTNLITNAMKYGASGRWIGVRLIEADGGVEVEVADRGIGISPQDAPHIFERYYRSSDPRARKHKGTGIGLAIVKYIMDSHAGRVSVASNPGRGTIFRLFFPFSNPATRQHGDAR